MAVTKAIVGKKKKHVSQGASGGVAAEGSGMADRVLHVGKD